MILVCFLLFHYFVFWKFTFNYEDFASTPSTIFDKLTKSEEHLIFKDLGKKIKCTRGELALVHTPFRYSYKSP